MKAPENISVYHAGKEKFPSAVELHFPSKDKIENVRILSDEGKLILKSYVLCLNTLYCIFTQSDYGTYIGVTSFAFPAIPYPSTTVVNQHY